jgi:hypothetical protein
LQRSAVLVGSWGFIMGVGAKEEVERMVVEILAERTAL